MPAPIVVTATFGDGDNGWLQALRQIHYPLERNRVPAHLTLFHHLPPGAADELDLLLARVARTPRPAARIAGILDLGGGTAFRVESAALEEAREAIARSLHGLLMPQDQAPWRPHVTIQNKVAPTAARALRAELKVGFAARPLAISGLASWHYRDGPWEPIKRYPFRG